MSAAQRNRGARAEVQVVNYLRSGGWSDARRYLAGDGRQPGDIDWTPLVCLEVKDRADSAWPTWCRQTLAEARPGMVPCVVRRTRGVPDVGAWEVRAPIWEWMEVFDLDEPWDFAGTVAVDGVAWIVTDMASLVAAVRAEAATS